MTEAYALRRKDGVIVDLRLASQYDYEPDDLLAMFWSTMGGVIEARQHGYTVVRMALFPLNEATPGKSRL